MPLTTVNITNNCSSSSWLSLKLSGEQDGAKPLVGNARTNSKLLDIEPDTLYEVVHVEGRLK